MSNTIGSIDSQKEPEKKKPKFNFKFNKLSIYFLIFVGVILVAGAYQKHQQEEALKQEQLKNEEDAQMDAILSEPHSAMNYHITEGTAEDAVHSTAILIAHVLTTGCKEAYSILMNSFDGESMTYLQDSLGGYTCSEWKTPPYATLSSTDEVVEYKIKYNSRIYYIAHINLNEQHRPADFQIVKYESRDKIYSENDVEYSDEHPQGILITTEATTVETTMATTTTVETTSETTETTTKATH